MHVDASRGFRLASVSLVGIMSLPPLLNALFSAQKVVGVQGSADARTLPAMGLLLLFTMALSGLFAWSTWVVTKPRPNPDAGWVQCLLGLQLLLSALLALELLHLMVAQIGATLSSRYALRWLAIVTLFLIVIAGLAVWDGSFEPTAGLERLPLPVQVIASVLNMSAWNCFAFFAGRVIVAERTRRQELSFLNGELRSTRDLLEQSSRLNERLRIARDLHDTLGHHLTALAVNLELASKLPLDESRAIVARSHLVSKLLLNDVRETVAALRQDRTIDVSAALKLLADGVPALHVHLDLPEACLLDDAEKAHALLRCAQEGLTNSLRHSGARNVWIKLDQDGLEFTLRDDGRGVQQLIPGNGLHGMRERVEALGGTLRWFSGSGQGFRIFVSLPPKGEQACSASC
jgi:signal transduction histidine kinase